MIASHLLRHALKKPSVAPSCLPLVVTSRPFSQNSGRGGKDGPSDLELHQGYTGFGPRFNAAKGLLFTQEGEDKFEMYVDAKIGGGFVSKMMVLTDLEHPLFLKYHFDARDFMTGARDAFETITGEVLHSAEFREYVQEQQGEREGEGGGEGSVEEQIQDFIRQSEAPSEARTTKEKETTEVEGEEESVVLKQEQEKSDQLPAETLSATDTPVQGEEGGKNEDDDEAPELKVKVNVKEEEEKEGTPDKVEFLASVCTEQAFQDFVNIAAQEAQMTHKFVIIDEKLESYYLARASIDVEEYGE